MASFGKVRTTGGSRGGFDASINQCANGKFEINAKYLYQPLISRKVMEFTGVESLARRI
jgi:hypothetical protein